MSINKKTSVWAVNRVFALFIKASCLVFIVSGCFDKRINKQDGEAFAELNELIELGVKKVDSDDVVKGIQFIDSAVAERDLDIRQKVKVLSFKTGVYFFRKDATNSLIYVDSILQLIEENGKEQYNEEYAMANYSKGDILFLQKKYAEAYHHYFIARNTGKASLDQCTLSEYSYRTGMILYQQARFAEAAENFEEAFMQSEKCSVDFISFYRRQELLANTGLSFLKAGLCDSALVYCDRALEYIGRFDGKFKSKQFFNEVARAVIYETKGEAYKKLGDYSKAEELFKESIRINTKKGYDNRNAELGQVHLAEVYFENDKIESMFPLLNKVRQGLDTLQNKEVEIEWNKLMWLYNESKSKIGPAFSYLKNYASLQDSALEAKSKLKDYDVNQQIKTLEDQYKISSLEKENRVKTLYLVIFLIAIILVVVIFSFSLYILKNTRKNLKVLTGLHSKIEDQKTALEHSLSQLQEMNREKDRILHAVAHDLRTPVASISMLVDLIMSERDDGRKTEMVRLMKTSSDNCMTLITEILESAGSEVAAKLPKQKVVINELLEAAVAPLQMKAAEKLQTIELELLTPSLEVLINKEKMERVVINLISNAIKFSGPNTQIKAKALQRDEAVEIIVQDTGIGIPENLKNRVFDMFTEARRPGTAGEKPFGLGLSICRQIVEAHGGSIWFESEEGLGTTFFVKLNYN